MSKDGRGENIHVCVFVCNKNCFALIFFYLFLSVLIFFVFLRFSFERQKEYEVGWEGSGKDLIDIRKGGYKMKIYCIKNF